MNTDYQIQEYSDAKIGESGHYNDCDVLSYYHCPDTSRDPPIPVLKG